jgi:alanyl-tRNA synthetase
VSKDYYIKTDRQVMICGCSYVLRRILRRAVRFSSEKLNGQPGMFGSLVEVVIKILVRAQD